MRASALCAAALALSTGAGCVGANTSVVAPDAHYPVSLSRAVRDRDGSLVPGERRKVVGTFDEKRTAWSMFYKLVRLTPKTDLSASIDRQVKAAGGDAIVNLRVGTLHCGLNVVPFLPALPLWPGCARVFVRGDIVKVLPASTAGAAKAPTLTGAETAAPKAPAPAARPAKAAEGKAPSGRWL
ncbi:MAG TPA: hypothetical protein VFS43_04560 [Polyangiaceae bacterium]|nr:hypothetical protein [Polyangiaceae bacterium]